MSESEALKEAVHNAISRLDSAVSTVNGLRETVKKLNDQLSAGPDANTLSEIAALAAELNQHVASFDKTLNPQPEQTTDQPTADQPAAEETEAAQ